MFELGDLKQTRFYKEIESEGRLNGKLEAIPRMIDFGLSLKDIAQLLDLSLEVVQKTAEYLEERLKGKLESKLETIPRMIQFGLSLEDIAQLLDLSLEVVQQAAQQSQSPSGE